MNTIPLADLSRELKQIVEGPVPGYRVLYVHVIDGDIPATRKNGRWYCDRKDLPAIAEQLCSGSFKDVA